ncbi:MAG: long-chain fatty acid--CoA ligase, partial [Archaeoglobaceae archaeon]
MLGVEGRNLSELEAEDIRRVWLKFYDDGVKPSLEYPEIPAYRILESAAERFGNKTAAIFLGNRITYSQANDASDKVAKFLADRGVEKGDRVIVCLPNTPHYSAIAAGIMKVGGIVVQCNPLYTRSELEFLAKDSGAKGIFYFDAVHPNVSPLVGELLDFAVSCSIQDFVPGASKPPEVRKGDFFTWDDVMKCEKTDRRAKIDPKNDVAMLQYTGGTTGKPKGVMLTHYNLVVNATQVLNWDPKASPDDVGIGVLPVFHVYGMTMLNVATLIGSTVIPVPDPRNYPVILEIIQAFRVTTLAAVPTMYVGMLSVLEEKNYDVSSLRICTSGAAPLPVEVKRRWEEVTGKRIVEGYGLSEASPVTHCNPLYGLNKEGSIGIPMPDTFAVVVDDDGYVLEPGEVGELAVFGPQVMKGYWKMEEETKKVLINGWLLTGDMAKMDEDGYFYIVDRKKDLIIAGGYNVYPREVEEVLYEHPAVLEAAVVGVPDPYRGETVKAFVVLRPEYRGKVTAEDLEKWCRERLAPYKVPKLWEFREELPKSMVGKVLRRVLRE